MADVAFKGSPPPTPPGGDTGNGPPNLTPDQKAAHQFLAELRTRISVQPLPYRDGVEKTALASLHSLFAASREAIKSNPGCAEFAAVVTDALNLWLRPMTARWHRGAEEGKLASRDGGDAFRAELRDVRERLTDLAKRLHLMAYDEPFPDRIVNAEIGKDELDELMKPIPFGFQAPLADQTVANAIEAAEREEVKARRGVEAMSRGPERPYAPPENANAAGLALSGGGIRSAAFCLGVIQVLADERLIGEFDFLSTVSGGGFAGAFLSQRLRASNEKTDLAREVGGAEGPDPGPIRYVRRLSKYLMVEQLWKRWQMASAGFAGLLLNWTSPLCALAALAVLARQFEPWSKGIVEMLGYFSLTLAAVSLASLAGYGVATRNRWATAGGWGVAFGLSLAALLATSLFWSLGFYHTGIRGFISELPLKGPTIGLGAVVGAVPTLMRFLPVAKSPAVRERILKVALTLAVFVVPATLLIVFHLLLQLDDANAAKVQADLPWRAVAAPWALGVAVASGLVAAFGLNINQTGPHRLYRNRIAETFVHSEEKPHDHVHLVNLGGGRAPYHLINAALNLPDETTPALRERKCDFFFFSKRYCGAASTGYSETKDWSADGRALDLATAVAVSGAAVAPNMGLASYPTLRAMLTLLNARLSFWLLRPRSQTPWDWFPHRSKRAPGFFCLLREMTGFDMNAKSLWLCLSDGGHIENLGLYELLRRRCKFIVCVDAEQDGDYRFPSFTRVMRQAQIDFGIRIRPELGDLRPDPATGRSRAHYAFCPIVYGENEPPGFLLYLKSSLTGDEDEMLKRYKLVAPEFPHHSTLDQFFDEECFEMYRRLGAHVASGLFGPAIMDKTTPAGVKEWFSQLAVSLLEPKRPLEA